MSTSRDVEKGEPDAENRALLRARIEGRQDDREHLNRVGDIELADFEKPGPSSSNVASIKVKTEELYQFQEPDLSEGTIKPEKANESDESTGELQKPEPDQNFSLIEAIYNYGNEELISWLEDFTVPKACPIPILKTTCQAQSNEEALRILLDAGRETNRFRCIGITPLHAAAVNNKPKSIAKILCLAKGSTNKTTAGYRRHSLGLIEEIEQWVAIQNIPLGYTALHVASVFGYSQVVRVLLEAGANPNLRDKSNSTPLDVAGMWWYDDNPESYVETLQLLRKYGGTLSRVEDLVLQRALRHLSLHALPLLLDAGAPINHRNSSGYTPMHLCVELKLQEHLKVLAHHTSPEMDYRAVDVTDVEGSTALHWAAREGWSDGVKVLLEIADVYVENSVGDTALHLATKAHHFDIVKQILDHDTDEECDIFKENIEGESPVSYAILSGNADIVKHMCYLDDMRFYLQNTKILDDLTPLEYAAEKKFKDLFILILDMINLNKVETIRIVKLIAKHNLPELYSVLEKNPSKIYSLKKIISKEYILHDAIKHRSREMINVLLREGADLSKRNEDGQTAINLLMYHVSKPTECMTEVLDGCIKTDQNIYDKDCVIKINYTVLKSEYISDEIKMLIMQILMHADDDDDDNDDSDDNDYDDNDSDDHTDDDNDHLKTKTNDMKVLEALIETGDVYDQRNLLTHPVVESFLYLKWKKCAKFIYFLISAYVLFLMSFNTFIVIVYYHMDHKIKEQDILFIFNPIFWRLTAISTFFFFFLVDICFWSSYKTKWRHNKTIWLHLLLIIGGLIMICIPVDAADTDIVRGVAVITVSLSWIYLMILLSWTPTLGYYMQMYGKVSRNVVKVMLSFSFPLVGFSICFMILLRSKEPFDDPIAAFLKTMVMMSSEFEYENLVKNADVTNLTLDSLQDAPLTSVFMLRIFFLLFLICVAIVLMNLMLGVAVSDFQELSHDGKQRRLMKQIECIIALETLFQRKPFNLFKFTETETWKVPSEVQVTSDSKIFSKKIKENVLNKAQNLKEFKEKKEDDFGMKAKIDDMYDLTKKQPDFEKELSEIRKSVNTISEAVALIKDASEKRINEAVDKILDAIANERRGI